MCSWLSSWEYVTKKKKLRPHICQICRQGSAHLRRRPAWRRAVLPPGKTHNFSSEGKLRWFFVGKIKVHAREGLYHDHLVYRACQLRAGGVWGQLPPLEGARLQGSWQAWHAVAAPPERHWPALLGHVTNCLQGKAQHQGALRYQTKPPPTLLTIVALANSNSGLARPKETQESDKYFILARWVEV